MISLRLTRDRLSVCRLPAGAPTPLWATGGSGFVSVTRTPAEVSVVCASSQVPGDVRREDGWRALVVDGPLSFETTGILAGLSEACSEAGVPIFVVSTYDTDWLLVKEADLEPACSALEAAGYGLERS